MAPPEQRAQPWLSVIIPCYNQGRFLAAAIESVLNQRSGAVEVIVVNDGSSDGTAEVAARYAGRIRYLYQPNAGLSAARNTGLLEARGEFVLVLDADDYLYPDTLTMHAAVAARNLDADVFHGGVQYVDSLGHVLGQRDAERLTPDPFHALLAGNPLACHSLTIRRRALAEVGFFDIRLRAAEDWDLWLRLAVAGREFVPVPGALVAYRRHPGQMTTEFERMWSSGLTVLRKAWRHHPGCPLCGEARVRVKSRYYRWCSTLLWDEVMAATRQGKILAGAAMMIRHVCQSPVLLPLLTEEFLHRLRCSAGRLRRRRALPTDR